jgi:uncharacterized metal-binding protein YceD (DUF177 family)
MNMRRPLAEPSAEPSWRVPVTVRDIPETGRHFDLAADDLTRAAIAGLAGLASLPRLEASFDVARHGREGLHITGHVSATVGQTCVVTLEPIENEVEEALDLLFVPGAAPAPLEEPMGVDLTAIEAPEPLIDGTVDLGALATEFLVLGLDPYPRKPDAAFEPPAPPDDVASGPFAALAALQKPRKSP